MAAKYVSMMFYEVLRKELLYELPLLRVWLSCLTYKMLCNQLIQVSHIVSLIRLMKNILGNTLFMSKKQLKDFKKPEFLFPFLAEKL